MQARRREFLAAVAAALATGPFAHTARAQSAKSGAADIYALPRHGNARVLHITDTHAQLLPVRFREPSVNLGIGAALGKTPHVVGDAFLKHFGISAHTPLAHAFTCLDFETASRQYGRLGGYAHIATLVNRLRSEAGAANTVLLDGGDTWQGSWVAHASKGEAMVEICNLLGVDAMTSHFEMTYGAEQFRANLAKFKGSYVAQNVFATDEAALNGTEMFDEESGRVFRPYVIKEVGGRRLAVIGQCFPYIPIAHPRRFVPDWTFGIRDSDMQKVVNQARSQDKADAVVVLSHNGMDVDLKLASRVTGIDVILGGHTHDAVPQPVAVKNAGGTTLVANAGSNGKFLGVLDLDIGIGKLNDVRYTLLPVFADLLPEDAAMAAKIAELRAPHTKFLDEKLATAGEVLYRRGNFAGTLDHVICEALTKELDAEIAISPGFRWGTSLLPGEAVTMDALTTSTAITYPDVYVQEMTGDTIKTVLEDVCDNLFNPDPYVQQGGDMVRTGGMDFTCTPNNTMGNRISDMTLFNGTKIEAGKTYKVAGWASVTLEQGKTPVWETVAKHLRSVGTVKTARPSRVTLKGVDGNPGIMS
ncbi:MAG: thiosulfohydrolase SoxB [Acetobacteraceae bacterium]|nr:thiosulfohydrolase SoxB [Acetobacteraceae bacterium]